MAIEVLYFVDVFVFLDCTVTREAELVDHTNDVYELISFCMNSGVEVFLRRCLVRWLTVEWHDCWSVVMSGEDGETGERRRFGGAYVRPDRQVEEFRKAMPGMEGCNIIQEDLNARNTLCGGKAGDNRTNTYGAELRRWIDLESYNMVKPTTHTFRNKSVLDITLYRKDHGPPVIGFKDQVRLEHVAQILHVKVAKRKNAQYNNTSWKKVDRGKVEMKWQELQEDEREWNVEKAIM